jgi:hypothetical protein
MEGVQRAFRIEFDGEQAHVGLNLFTGEPSLDIIGGGEIEQEVEVGVSSRRILPTVPRLFSICRLHSGVGDGDGVKCTLQSCRSLLGVGRIQSL